MGLEVRSEVYIQKEGNSNIPGLRIVKKYDSNFYKKLKFDLWFKVKDLEDAIQQNFLFGSRTGSTCLSRLALAKPAVSPSEVVDKSSTNSSDLEMILKEWVLMNENDGDMVLGRGYPQLRSGLGPQSRDIS